MAAALAHDGPVLIDAVVNRQELAMPQAVTVEMAKGFTLFMVKAVMSGRGNELMAPSYGLLDLTVYGRQEFFSATRRAETTE